MEYLITMPLFVMIGKKKRVKKVINLNYYRNYHFRVNHQVKKAYQEIVAQRTAHIPKLEKIRLEFTLFKKSRVQKDKANFLSIHEKFFCDSLTQTGILDDDTDDYIIEQHYKPSLIDKNYPRVEINIISLSTTTNQ